VALPSAPKEEDMPWRYEDLSKALLVLEQSRLLADPASSEMAAKLECLSVAVSQPCYFGNFETAREQ
jgi:hypothetical protein